MNVRLLCDINNSDRHGIEYRPLNAINIRREAKDVEKG
jgi:hypothetical protein